MQKALILYMVMEANEPRHSFATEVPHTNMNMEAIFRHIRVDLYVQLVQSLVNFHHLSTTSEIVEDRADQFQTVRKAAIGNHFPPWRDLVRGVRY
jgi:hypothetical protein